MNKLRYLRILIRIRRRFSVQPIQLMSTLCNTFRVVADLCIGKLISSEENGMHTRKGAWL
jgi:hypothetical protein